MSVARIIPSWLTTCFAEQNAELLWLRDLQQQQGHAFLQRGIPSRREEHWKYTDVTFLEKQHYNKASVIAKPQLINIERLQGHDSIVMVIVNGHVIDALSDTRLLPKQVVLCSLKQALKTHTAVMQQQLNKVTNLQRYPFASLNTALMDDGIFLHVPKNTIVSAPIHLLYINTGENNYVTCPRNIFLVDEQSQVTLIEEHTANGSANYFTNIMTEITAAPNAQIEYYKIQNESLQATHIAQTFVHQKQDSSVKLCAVAIGSRLARDDIFVKLAERGASCSVNGFYKLNQDGQHVDNHIQIDHIAEHCNSDMLYKGIMDKKSHAVFNGKLFVHENAQKTQSYQANHNLLLSPEAAIDTKPELEIYADDVKCAHAATTGQLDTESLFYLRSRGIDKPTAIQLLTYAYAAEVMNKISPATIKLRMNALINETPQ